MGGSGNVLYPHQHTYPRPPTPSLLIRSSFSPTSISEKMDRYSLSCTTPRPAHPGRWLSAGLGEKPPANLSAVQAPQRLVSLLCIIQALELNTSVIFLPLETRNVQALSEQWTEEMLHNSSQRSGTVQTRRGWPVETFLLR